MPSRRAHKGAEAAPDVRPGDPSDKLRTTPPFQWGVIYLFARIFYGMRSRCEEALRPYGLTPMQFTILATLGRWPELSSAELSRRFNVTPQTMGEMIGNLERRSLLTRSQDPNNRRALLLSLTEEGRLLVKECNLTMGRVEAEMVAGLSQREQKDLRARLATLHDHLGLPVG